MAGPSHPDAMAPPKPGRTRTAPPQTPKTWWSSSRIITYLLFDATGILYFLIGFEAISLTQALALGKNDGGQAWHAALERLHNPVYIAFHLLCLVAVVFVAVRFFRLFPKAQPPKIGPAKPPPQPVIMGMLYVVWIGITAILGGILAGAF